MEEYNLNLSNPAYHCGGLMAVYAAIQRTAMPDVNTGIVERYYASAIQMPALVIGQLSSRSNHHLEKMENKWLANQYQEKLRQVSRAGDVHSRHTESGAAVLFRAGILPDGSKTQSGEKRTFRCR